jgi:RHS repeat-associated protein
MTKQENNDTMSKQTYQFNAANQLNVFIKTQNGASNQANYTYYGDGLRATKTVDGTTTRFVYFNGQIIDELDASSNLKARNIWGNQLIYRIVKKTDGNQIGGYYFYNWHGDVVKIKDSTGSLIKSYSYDVWGNVTNGIDNNAQFTNPFKYTGEYQDDESGLVYLRARYYDSKEGRFLSVDSYDGNLNDPLTLNLYTYTQNNPLIYNDPTGHFLNLIIGAGIGAVVGATIAIYQGKSGKEFWGSVAGGAVTGLMASTGVGLAGIISAGALGGASGYITDNLISGRDSTLSGTLNSAAFGAMGSMAGIILGKVATASLSKLDARSSASNISTTEIKGATKSFTVDSSMLAADEAAGVLKNGSYIKNPTARNINDLITDSGKIGSKEMSGQYMYVVDMNGNIVIGTRAGQRMPHPTLVGGVNPQVQAAGIVEIRAGKIYKIDNASGHFKPSKDSLQAAQNAFSQLPSSAFSPKFQGYVPYSQ